MCCLSVKSIVIVLEGEVTEGMEKEFLNAEQLPQFSSAQPFYLSCRQTLHPVS
jgi:hypothetical protein